MKEKKPISDTGFVLLSQAIIERACNDYVLEVKYIKEMQSKDWYAILKKKCKNKRLPKKVAIERRVDLIDEAEREINRIRRFFRSDWFAVLSDLDPDYLIERLDREAML